jgi:hypothetical protein
MESGEPQRDSQDAARTQRLLLRHGSEPPERTIRPRPVRQGRLYWSLTQMTHLVATVTGGWRQITNYSSLILLCTEHLFGCLHRARCSAAFRFHGRCLELLAEGMARCVERRGCRAIRNGDVLKQQVSCTLHQRRIGGITCATNFFGRRRL